jgi:hypothetical protein
MVGLIYPGLGTANAGTLMPVGGESIVYVKKRKKTALYKTRPIVPRAGQRAARREVQKHKPTRGVKIPDKGS